MSSVAPAGAAAPTSGKQPSGQTAQAYVSPELIFAVVGPLGSGTSEIARALEDLLSKTHKVTVVKARDLITTWASKTGYQLVTDPPLAATESLQDAGDQWRLDSKDNAAVALAAIAAIRNARAARLGLDPDAVEVITPDDVPTAYIIDSLRNPAEVTLLRRVYQQSFCLIGVVCEEEEREKRLLDKFPEAGKDPISKIMERDERADQKYGQHVASTFHLADFFLDNSQARLLSAAGGSQQSNPQWNVVDELGRLIDILTHHRVVRPRPNEAAMYAANGAKMQSSCLSRQVGAALMDAKGEVISTGTNEVPRAGGGVYGGAVGAHFDKDPAPTDDFRCHIHGGYCRNTESQNEIIDEVRQELSKKELKLPDGFEAALRSTRLGQLIEFSRAVHGEMDAILSAGRQGKSTLGTRLFVTTFPCHNCARHIVSAGIDEVQFIEPYLKSKPLPLHGDAITSSSLKWTPPSKAAATPDAEGPPQVLFRPFTGVAPRLYRRAFFKDRDLKDAQTGKLLADFPPKDGTGAIENTRISYAELEAKLLK